MSDAMLSWLACELHCHSLHSDGGLSVAALARRMRGRGLDLLALTDHNTVSGLAEIPAARGETGIEILPSMELTTFYGHILALGIEEYVEWRDLGPSDAGTAIAAIHAGRGLAGVAHPFRPGSPFCTGCYWEFTGFDWGEADYLEVWSEPDPPNQDANRRAFDLWTSLLDAGFRLSATSGTDYHGREGGGLEAVTYLGADLVSPADGRLAGAAREALRAGRAVVSLGPMLSLAVRGTGDGRSYRPGDVLPASATAGGLVLEAAVDRERRREQWAAELELERVALRGSGGELGSARADDGILRLALPPAAARPGPRWIRAELYGRLRGEEALLAFTNPIYFER